MRVSIVIPTFNRAEYLDGAIKSALMQDYADLEVIVSDNASSDNTEQVVQKFLHDPRVKYFRNPQNIGMVPNWHKAIFEHSTGDWFLLLSDDDILTNGHLVSEAVEIIQSDRTVTVVYSSAFVFDQSLNVVSKLVPPFARIESGERVFSLRGTVKPQDFALCGVLFPKKLAAAHLAFSNVNNLSCDTELFLRLCLNGKVGVVKDFSSVYRMHSGSLLKSVSKNTDLVIGSLDSLLNPLLDAEKQGLSSDLVRDFVRNSRLKREIMICLVKTAAVNRPQAKQLAKKLEAMVGHRTYQAFPSLLTVNLLLRLGSFVVPMIAIRRKTLYVLSSLKRSLFGKQVYFEAIGQRVYVIE